MAEGFRVKPHALILPLPSQSHIASLLSLALKLANNGVTITMASFKNIISSIRTKYAKELQNLDFHLLELGHDPGDVGLVKVTEGVERGFQALLEKLDSDRLAGIAIPTCIMADIFFPWTEDAAARLGIKRYIFLASGVILARLYQEVPRLFEEGKLQLGENVVIPFDGVISIPGVGSLGYPDIPLSVRVLHDKVVRPFSQGRGASSSLVVNTFYDLESSSIELFQTFASSQERGNNFRKVFPVGPIATITGEAIINETLVETGRDFLQWLDSQPAESVLYICLGSITRIFPPQIKQLALALQACKNCRFLWALHRGEGNFKSLEDVLPPDFETNVKGRGLVTTGWVPQVQVLAHPSTGGFLSHCGWGSTLESMSAGVPMIGWPHVAEQPLNCRYLVDTLKVAVEVVRGPGSIVHQKEFEDAFAILFGDQGRDMRERCTKLRVQAAAAVAPAGSSHNAFMELIDDMSKCDPS